MRSCNPARDASVHGLLVCSRIEPAELARPWMGHLPEGTVRRRNATHLPPHLWRRAVPSGGTAWASSGRPRDQEQVADGQSHDDRGKSLMREAQPERDVGQQCPYS